jgi:predicted HTH transcriptional regulator
MHDALREALANALIYADYNERRGIVIEKRKGKIVISNPGALRIAKAEAISGGISDPRNAAVFFMFSLIGIGERAGSGLFGINMVWEQYKLPKPKIEEQFNPDRTVLTLKLDAGESADIGNSIGNNIGNVVLSETQNRILVIIKENPKATAASVAKEIGIAKRNVEEHFKTLRKSGAIERIGGTRGYWAVKEK